MAEPVHKPVIVVDDDDHPVGMASLREVVASGQTTRATRILLQNSAGDVLIQRRALQGVFHPGLWDATAAGIVDAGEDYIDAAKRELEEEMGISGVELRELTRTYETSSVWNGELKLFIKVFTGHYDGSFTPDPREVADGRWVRPSELLAWAKAKPAEFTPHFLTGLTQVNLLNL